MEHTKPIRMSPSGDRLDSYGSFARPPHNDIGHVRAEFAGSSMAKMRATLRELRHLWYEGPMPGYRFGIRPEDAMFATFALRPVARSADSDVA